MTEQPTYSSRDAKPRGRARGASWQRRAGAVVAALSLPAWGVWFGWWLTNVPAHPLPIVVLFLEMMGALAGLVVTVGLLRAQAPRRVYVDERWHTHRYGLSVADLVGRTRVDDVRRHLSATSRAARTPHQRGLPDVAMAGALSDAPRRLATLAVVTLGVLVGVSPIPLPPVWAMVSAAVALATTSLAHMLVSGRRIRIGDRTRWSYSSLGEIVVSDEVDGVAPRRWVGTMAAAVIVNLAIALRGMSDRWTHGLPAMDHGERSVAVVTAFLLVVGALFTLATTPAPRLDNAHLVARRIEERTARASVLASAVCVGLIGLIAGVLTGDVDAADGDPAGVEQLTESPAGDVGG